MKKSLTILILNFTISVGYSQDIKKVVIRNCINDHVSEIYFVKKSDETTKHGIYQEYSCSEHKTDENIVDTSKIHPFGLMLSGKYANGQKVEVWSKAKRTDYGYIIERYNHSANQNLEPIFEVTLKYPPLAQENDIQGEVELSFQENIDCTISDIRVTKSLGMGCVEEAKRKIRKLYELKREHNCKCEPKNNSLKFEFKLD